MTDTVTSGGVFETFSATFTQTPDSGGGDGSGVMDSLTSFGSVFSGGDGTDTTATLTSWFTS